MPEWDDWNSFLTDGLRIWGFRMVITLPLLVLMFGGMGLYFIFLILGTSQSNSHTTSPLIFAGLLVFLIVMAVFMVFAISFGVVSIVCSPHVVAKKSFFAGVALRGCGQIFVKNIGTVIFYYIIPKA